MYVYMSPSMPLWIVPHLFDYFYFIFGSLPNKYIYVSVHIHAVTHTQTQSHDYMNCLSMKKWFVWMAELLAGWLDGWLTCWHASRFQNRWIRAYTYTKTAGTCVCVNNRNLTICHFHVRLETARNSALHVWKIIGVPWFYMRTIQHFPSIYVYSTYMYMDLCRLPFSVYEYEFYDSVLCVRIDVLV